MDNNLGENLKVAREAACLTQEELGAKIGVTGVTIMRYEKGQREPRVVTLQRIAKVLGISLEYLMRTKILADSIIEKLDDIQTLNKYSYAKAYRDGLIDFNSDEERAYFFYTHLNDSGKIVVTSYLFQHLSPNAWHDVADYILSLSENPSYQKEPEKPLQIPSPPKGETTPEEK